MYIYAPSAPSRTYVHAMNNYEHRPQNHSQATRNKHLLRETDKRTSNPPFLYISHTSPCTSKSGTHLHPSIG